jgi:hypothetical protein
MTKADVMSLIGCSTNIDRPVRGSAIIIADGNAALMTSDKNHSLPCTCEAAIKPNNNMPGLWISIATKLAGLSTVEVVACEAWADLAAIDKLVAANTPVSRQALTNHCASGNEWLGPAVHEHADSAEELSAKCLLRREPQGTLHEKRLRAPIDPLHAWAVDPLLVLTLCRRHGSSSRQCKVNFLPLRRRLGADRPGNSRAVLSWRNCPL